MEPFAVSPAYAALPPSKWPIDVLHGEYRRLIYLPSRTRADLNRAYALEAALVTRMGDLIRTKANLQKTILDVPESTRKLMIRRGRTAVRLSLRQHKRKSDIPFLLYLFARIDAAVLSVVIDRASI